MRAQPDCSSIQSRLRILQAVGISHAVLVDHLSLETLGSALASAHEVLAGAHARAIVGHSVRAAAVRRALRARYRILIRAIMLRRCVHVAKPAATLIRIRRHHGRLTKIIVIPPVPQLYNALIQLIICVLAERLVSGVLVGFGVGNTSIICCCIHRRIHRRLINRLSLRSLHNFLRLRRDIAYAAHSTLKANIIHLIHWLACFLHDPNMPILIHRGNLALKPIHKITCLRGLPRRLVLIVGHWHRWLRYLACHLPACGH